MTQKESNSGHILFEPVIDLEFPKQINLDYLFSSEGFVSPQMELPLAGIDFHCYWITASTGGGSGGFRLFPYLRFGPTNGTGFN